MMGLEAELAKKKKVVEEGIKEVKKLDWDYIGVSKKNFRGCVHSYLNEDGEKVALCFNMHEAFVVEDGQGLFGVEDLIAGVIKAKDIDVENPQSIYGATIIAYEEDGEVIFVEEELKRLKISSYDITSNIEKRLKLLSKLDVTAEWSALQGMM